MAKKFCCCGTNLKAAKILAIVFIVLRVIQLALSAYAWANFDNLRGQYDGDDIDTVKTLIKVSTAIQGVLLLVDICLLVGSIKKIAGLLWVWLIVAAVSVVYIVVSGILAFNILNIIVAAISAGLTIWAMLAVYGAIQEIKEEIQAETDYYRNQEF